MLKIGLRSTAANLEKAACILSVSSVQSQPQPRRVVHLKVKGCIGNACQLNLPKQVIPVNNEIARRLYGSRGGPREERKLDSDSDSDCESDTRCKGTERSAFWRRKMRTLHNILDVNKDGLISYNDFQLLGERFTALGHLDEDQSKEFNSIIKLTWEEQWGEIDPYNFVTVETYLEDMNHALNDKSLRKKAYRWLPYLFKAVDKDKSGFISVKEFKLFFKCLGLESEHAAVAFAIIDTNGDGKLSMKEFVSLGKDFFFSEDDKKVSRMFWGPLIDH